MENNKLNNKVIENVRNRVVISNLEREENMKMNRKKQIMSVIAVMIVMSAGSFITVNAATDGKLVQKVKDTIVILIDKEGKQEEIQGITYTNSKNHTIEEYKTKTNETEHILKIDKSNLDESSFTITGNLEDDVTSVIIENK